MGSGLRLLPVATVTVLYVCVAFGAFPLYLIALSLQVAACQERATPGEACPSYELWFNVGLIGVTLPAVAMFAAGIYWVWLADQRPRRKAAD